MILIGLKRCSTCKNIEKILQDKGLTYTYREIDSARPTAEELKEWWRKSGLTLNKFFNTSGILYRERGLATKRLTMSEDEQLQLLATDGMLVKRPILLTEDEVIVGADVKKWLNR